MWVFSWLLDGARAIVVLIAGIVSGTAVFVLGEMALEGNLTTTGWIALTICATVFVCLVATVIMGLDREREGYLRLVAGLPISSQPQEFINRVPQLATEFHEILAGRGVRIDPSASSLPSVTEYLKELGEEIRQEPKLLQMASAHFGHILQVAGGGDWKEWKKGRHRDAVVRLGKGVSRHDVSPGLLILRVAEDSKSTLEAFLAHELEELNLR